MIDMPLVQRLFACTSGRASRIVCGPVMVSLVLERCRSHRVLYQCSRQGLVKFSQVKWYLLL